MNKVKFCVISLILLLAVCAVCTAVPADQTVASAAGLTDMVTPKIVGFYEEKIAGEPFISSMSEGTRTRLKDTYDVNDTRLNALLILEDLGARTGKPQNLRELSQMSDNRLFSTGKTLINAYSATLSDEEKDELKAGFKALFKR